MMIDLGWNRNPIKKQLSAINKKFVLSPEVQKSLETSIDGLIFLSVQGLITEKERERISRRLVDWILENSIDLP